MGRISSRWFVFVAGMAAVTLIPVERVSGAVEEAASQTFAEATTGAVHLPGNTADVEVRFVQEDGPESGHVRVELTPETRPLTWIEARSAAQQGFLAALNEPGLGDDLSQILVVVKLMPASHPDPGGSEQRVLFVHRGGREWSVLSGD
jgi:hypothetical protein